MTVGGPGAPAAATGWTVERRSGSVEELHALDVPERVERAVWLLDHDRPALVLGSTQPGSDGPPGSAGQGIGIDVVRRRSGGGAVLLDPRGELGAGRTVWIDVLLGRDDPLWSDDVGRSMWWLGETWQRALAALAIEATVHTGALVRNRYSPLVCFAGLGPGEVLVGGRKAVGISQRRTRAGARFQCVVLAAAAGARAADRGSAGHAAIASLLALPRDPADRADLAATLERTTTTVVASPASLVDAFLAALPTAG